jgi:hypothetical protein
MLFNWEKHSEKLVKKLRDPASDELNMEKSSRLQMRLCPNRGQPKRKKGVRS